MLVGTITPFFEQTVMVLVPVTPGNFDTWGFVKNNISSKATFRRKLIYNICPGKNSEPGGQCAWSFQLLFTSAHSPPPSVL